MNGLSVKILAIIAVVYLLAFWNGYQMGRQVAYRQILKSLSTVNSSSGTTVCYTVDGSTPTAPATCSNGTVK